MAQDDLAPVVRLYERLAEALQRTRRDPFNVPVTVAEIYQELVPYRLVRSEIGFDMNADYEHALLRLLAGEGERVRMEPGHAVDELRRELRAANPNLSMYRDYAACDVWVTKPAAPPVTGSVAPIPAAKPSAPAPAKQAVRAESARGKRPERDTGAEPATQPPATEPMVPVESTVAAPAAAPKQAEVETSPKTYAPGDATVGPFKLADSEQADEREEDDEQAPAPAMAIMSDAKKQSAATPAPAASVPSPEPSARAGRSKAAAEPAVSAPPARADAGLTAAAARCAFCDSELPAQRQARFCPYCGADQRTRPCAACGEALEPGWVFCIACGATAP